MFDYWQETPAGSGHYARREGSGSFARLHSDYANEGPAWKITARMKATDTPTLDNVVAKGN